MQNTMSSRIEDQAIYTSYMYSLNRLMQPGTPKKVETTNPKLRILSIDGGGIRAILPAMILAEMEEQMQRETGNSNARIVDYFDLFAGTSAGGILISLYLTPSDTDPSRPKFSAREVLDLYLNDGCACFAAPNTDAATARKNKYSAIILERKLQQLIGKETRFEQLLKPAVITAFDMATEETNVLRSWEDRDEKVWQLARGTSAAPGYFPPMECNGRQWIDGSLFAANPALCVYSVAHELCFSKFKECATNVDFPTSRDMVLLSVGTGKAPKSIDPKSSMMRRMMANLTTAGTAVVDNYLQQIFQPMASGSYFRFNPELPETGSAIDDVEAGQVEQLLNTGNAFLQNHSTDLQKLKTQLQLTTKL